MHVYNSYIYNSALYVRTYVHGIHMVDTGVRMLMG